ncbi:M16 family metallopeptidase [Stratiformator vulcanicus]|uniref:Peptidase M16 inactive domain protein n=1 Tax=Stratiformator vulcanicus TaxID=2527980 RepID=A0A517QXU3_9PLAN|nr:pitrilysin family protein [Stratiformator vulcanicus]QDT36451.1 Peptidase M16 inactive domain protein [Stratiformator vulcanicus]
MPDPEVRTHTYDNGLTLLVEPMADVKSASFSIMVPAGSVYDPPGESGSAAVLTELITRGAGPRNSRELSSDLDDLGTRRSESTGTSHLTFGVATLAENIPATLRIYRDILLSPRLPEAEFDASRAGVVQSVLANEDEPRSRTMSELRRRCYDVPWGLPTDGTLAGLEALSHQTVADHYRTCFRPNGAIVGVAGHVDFEGLKDLVDELLGDWPQQPEPSIETGPRGSKHDHITQDLTQTHIGISFDSIPYSHPQYFAAWAAASVLSGGMSSRLFTEVRERRGLCYAISASLRGTKAEGRLMCYAGTTNERAQETLDVTLGEFGRLAEGIEQNELDRCRSRAKSGLVMQQESTISRAGSIAKDWYHLGRVRTLDEVQSAIDALTVDDVLNFVRNHPPEDPTILTLGPDALELNKES